VWIDEAMTHSSVGGTVEIDLCDLGVVVLDDDGKVASTNDRARELLRADSQASLDARLRDLRRLSETQSLKGSMEESSVEVPGVGFVGVRSCMVTGRNGKGRVLLLRDARSAPGTVTLLQQAARHRSFAFFARDWAHDLKGMLHVIRINSALLSRLLQRDSPAKDAAITRCLDAIPREVDRLDRSIESMLGTRAGEQQTTFDIGVMCERLKALITPRAIRQRVEVAIELTGDSKEILGFEDEVQGALLNVLVNALEAMPEQGRLVISASGDATCVAVRVTDSGHGMQPQPRGREWRPQFVSDRRQTGIGLHVTRAVVETHGGRIECASNVPHGTCVEITFPPAASTGRLGHGSRTHR
jgi:signal transduction histidine kinase